MKFVKRVVIGWIAIVVAAVVAAFSIKKAVPAFGGESDDSFSIVAVIGGKDFVSTADRFEHGRALAFMGGIEMDLSGATLAPGAKVDLRAVMGGIDVTVPTSWRVEIIATERMGEVASSLGETDPDSDGPLLLVYASATMGGISITASQDT